MIFNNCGKSFHVNIYLFRYGADEGRGGGVLLVIIRIMIVRYKAHYMQPKNESLSLHH